jgi:hypothetical protein
MTDAPTTRETADHAELKRLAEAAKALWLDEGWFDYRTLSLGFELDSEDAAFIAAANPARVLALLSEIAALRGEVAALDEMRGVVRVVTARATQAERQRGELRKALEPFADIGSRYRTGGLRQDIESRAPSFMRLLDFKAFRHADSLIANQGADQ